MAVLISYLIGVLTAGTVAVIVAVLVLDRRNVSSPNTREVRPLPKARKDMIDADTYRRFKRMSLPQLNTYLYTIYLAGYTDGATDLDADRLRHPPAQPPEDEK